MNKKGAEELGGKLSDPSNMDVATWGIPATSCRIGTMLAQKEGTTCLGCYALKGSFKFPNDEMVLEEYY